MGPTALIHRDVSWLQFNDRVLGEACDLENPLLERAKFLAVSASNLDEFFQVRFSDLGRTLTHARKKGDRHRIRELERTRHSILREVNRIRIKQTEVLLDLSAGLSREGVHLFHSGIEDSDLFRKSARIFEQKILPLGVNLEPFSFLNLRTLGNFGTAAVFSNGFWWRVPKGLAPVHVLEERGKYTVFFLDDLLSLHLGNAFQIPERPSLIRITRDGDLVLEMEEGDVDLLPQIVKHELISRDQGRVVRLQYSGTPFRHFLPASRDALKLEEDQVLQAPLTLYLQSLATAVQQCPERLRLNPKLFYPQVKPRVPRDLRESGATFESIRKQDLLLHFPYDSFDTFTDWLGRCSADPGIKAIWLTAYRMETDSPIVESLIAAAKAGIRVRVIIELRARFDERNNIRIAEKLKKAGVQVKFGFPDLKLHAKVALVEREEKDGLHLYAHLSTGNYNSQTARLYTDLSLLTAREDLAGDVKTFLSTVWKGEVPERMKQLVTAPGRLHRRILQLIEQETKAAKAGKNARIFAKVNALVDETVISSLYKASSAGVRIDLVVRGACSLIPGLRGVSENIRVISIIDRYLEHSRIYYFENARALYFSSADWMPRNFYSRFEVAFPILEEKIFRYVEETLIPTYLSDNVKARELGSDGNWKQLSAAARGRRIRSQFHLQDLAQEDYQGTALE